MHLVHQWVRPSTCKERGDCTRASRKVMQILQTVGGPFEKASIDEAYMDVTEAVEGNWDQAIKRCADLQQGDREPFGTHRIIWYRSNDSCKNG